MFVTLLEVKVYSQKNMFQGKLSPNIYIMHQENESEKNSFLITSWKKMQCPNLNPNKEHIFIKSQISNSKEYLKYLWTYMSQVYKE